jgi:hypothetical protein
MKKGFIFSMDAFLAIVLFVFVLFLIYIFSLQSTNINQEYLLSNDILTLFSNLKIGELNMTNYTNVNKLISKGIINDTNVTISQQIIVFQLNGDQVNLNIFIGDIINKTINNNLKIAVYLNETKIYGDNPNKENILSRRRLITR